MRLRSSKRRLRSFKRLRRRLRRYSRLRSRLRMSTGSRRVYRRRARRY